MMKVVPCAGTGIGNWPASTVIACFGIRYWGNTEKDALNT